MTNSDKNNLIDFLKTNPTSSGIRDFCEDNNIDIEEAYDVIADIKIPPNCKGCCNKAFYPDMYPCHSCSRVERRDYFNVGVL